MKFTTDNRQLVEQVARGTTPIAFGAIQNEVERFKKAGFNNLAIVLPDDAPGYLTGGYSVLKQAKGVPHPNAATVFINWYVSRPGQEVYESVMLETSVRTDLNTGLPDYLVPRPGVEYYEAFNEHEYFSAQRRGEAHHRRARQPVTPRRGASGVRMAGGGGGTAASLLRGAMRAASTPASICPTAASHRVIRAFQSSNRITMMPCAREDEGIAIAVGLQLGGRTAVCMMEASGLGYSGLILARAQVQRTPVIIVASHTAGAGRAVRLPRRDRACCPRASLRASASPTRSRPSHASLEALIYRVVQTVARPAHLVWLADSAVHRVGGRRMNRIEAMDAVVGGARAMPSWSPDRAPMPACCTNGRDAPATIYNMEHGLCDAAVGLGIALACPRRRVLAIEGEGSFYRGCDRALHDLAAEARQPRGAGARQRRLGHRRRPGADRDGVWARSREPRARLGWDEKHVYRAIEAGRTRASCWRRRCGQAGRISSSARPTPSKDEASLAGRPRPKRHLLDCAVLMRAELGGDA